MILKQPTLPGYAGGTADPYSTFAAQMGPLLYQRLLRDNTPNIDTIYDYMIRQLAWESDYGRSDVARKQHNYGGYGWDGSTYTTFKNDEDFINSYVDLMKKRYRKAMAANSIQDYSKALKEKGYYEDTLEHYTSNLAGMRSISRAAAAHRKNNPDLYTLPTQEMQYEPTEQFQPKPVLLNPVEYNPQPHYGVSPYVDLNTAPTPKATQSWEQINQQRPMFVPDMSKGRQLRNSLQEGLQRILR